MRKLAVSWMISLVLVSAPALAQVYKWVDDSGKVTYGDKPPRGGVGARELVADSGSVSVVPGIPAEELERLRVRYEQQRLQQLEREVDELRARDQWRANVMPETVYAEGYLPVYAYRRPWRRLHEVGHFGHRPEQPIKRVGRPPTAALK